MVVQHPEVENLVLAELTQVTERSPLSRPLEARADGVQQQDDTLEQRAFLSPI